MELSVVYTISFTLLSGRMPGRSSIFKRGRGGGCSSAHAESADCADDALAVAPVACFAEVACERDVVALLLGRVLSTKAPLLDDDFWVDAFGAAPPRRFEAVAPRCADGTACRFLFCLEVPAAGGLPPLLPVFGIVPFYRYKPKGFLAIDSWHH